MNYTQAQIDRANAVSLEDFLRTQGETLIKSGREYRWKEHDSLTVRRNHLFPRTVKLSCSFQRYSRPLLISVSPCVRRKSSRLTAFARSICAWV